MPIAIDTLKKYRNKANVFIETGTHIGITTRMAVQLGYKKIYTIELADHFGERLYLRMGCILIKYLPTSVV